MPGSTGTFENLLSEPIANATKNRILDTAIDFFSKRGYSGVSIRDITREVGIKESSLYKHFKSKDEILETIFFNFRKRSLQILPPPEMLERISASMSLRAFLQQGWMNFKTHIDDPVMQRIWRIIYLELFRDPMARDIYFNHIVQRTLDCLEFVFGRMAAHGQMKASNPKMLAVEYQYPLFTMIVEYLMLKFEGKDGDKIEKQVSDHIEFFLKGVGV